MKNKNLMPFTLQAIKKISLYTLATSLAFGTLVVTAAILPPHNTVTVSADTVQVGQWGNANWSINNGELSLFGNNINASQSLSKTLTIAGVNPSTITSISIKTPISTNGITEAFANFPKLKTITGLNNLSYSGSAYCMFKEDIALTSLDLTGFNTSKITDMGFMFYAIPTSNLMVSDFDTSNVTSMYGMFDAAASVDSLDVSHFNTSKVTNMGYMFYGTKNLKALNLSSFDTSNVTNMEGMFDATSGIIDLDLSTFDTSKVTNMNWMFAFATSLKTLDLTHFNTHNVTTMMGMFDNASALDDLKLSPAFNTDHVTDMTYMFLNASSLTSLDLSNFTITPSTKTGMMLRQTSKMKALKLGEKSQLNTNMEIPDVPMLNYSGKWINSKKIDTWTSGQLMSTYKGAAVDTYVWQEDNTFSLGTPVTYENDATLTQINPSVKATPSKAKYAYRYNVILSKDYPLYSDLTTGQSDTQNIVSFDYQIGVTVYNRKQVEVIYTTGAKKGQKSTFENISSDGVNWYWIDYNALNLNIAGKYPAINTMGRALPPLDGLAIGSTTVYAGIPTVPAVTSQLVQNAYNNNGQIIYYPNIDGDNLSSKDREIFNANLDAVIASWTNAIGQHLFVKANSVNDPNITLKINVGSKGSGSASSMGVTSIDYDLIKDGIDATNAKNMLFITLRHELGHQLGLNHTGGGQYYGMPDNYGFSEPTDVMWAVVVSNPGNGETWGNQTIISDNDVNAIRLIQNNNNFQNPHPMQP